MEINIYGLKCDYCDYRDDSVKFSEYEENIGKPCPNCGNNLLTEKEYKTCLRFYKFVDICNVLNNIFKWINPFHYWRLIFGDNREENKLTMKFKNRKIVDHEQ